MDFLDLHERTYRRNLQLLLAFSFLRFAAFWQPIEQLYIYGIGGDEFVVAVGAALWTAAQVLFEVPSGYFSDMYGRKQAFLAGQIARLFGYLFIVIPETVHFFYLGVFLFGISFTFTSGADNAMMHETLEKLGESKSYKKYSGRMKSLNVAGVLLGALLAAPVSLVSYRFNFALSIVPVFVSIYLVLKMHEPKETRAHSDTSALQDAKGVFKLISKEHVLLFWISLIALLELIKRLGMDFGQSFLLDLSLSAFIVTLTWTAGAFGRLVGNELAHRYKAGLTPLVTASIGLFTLMSVSPRELAVLLYALFFIPVNMAIIINEEAIQKIAPARLRATTLSTVNFFNQLIVVVPILIFGTAITRTNAVDTFQYASFGIIAVASVIMLSLKAYHAKRL